MPALNGDDSFAAIPGSTGQAGVHPAGVRRSSAWPMRRNEAPFRAPAGRAHLCHAAGGELADPIPSRAHIGADGRAFSGVPNRRMGLAQPWAAPIHASDISYRKLRLGDGQHELRTWGADRIN